MVQAFSHTFAVCAYQESPFLNDCLFSLVRQTVKPNILICTSTPNAFIERLAAAYDLPVLVNTGVGTMTDNWNFAYHAAQTDYVTIVHQDDIYEEEYLDRIQRAAVKAGADTLLLHTGWRARTEEGVQRGNRCTLVQRFLNFPVCCFRKSKTVRRWILSLGNIIKASSVTYHKKKIGPGPLFSSEYEFVSDWMFFGELAKRDGQFVYLSKPLLQYRVHKRAITAQATEAGLREREDRKIFESVWPHRVATVVHWFYKHSYTTYNTYK